MTYIASSSKSDSFVWGSSGTHQGDETRDALMNTESLAGVCCVRRGGGEHPTAGYWNSVLGMAFQEI